jgi:cupin 2 domain-containing protein
MLPIARNLFAELPPPSWGEQSTELVATPGLRIERIVSTGQASPRGFWYDQPWAEWVVLLCGAAQIQFADDAQMRALKAGDCLLIPAHCRHRVAWTDAAAPTIWLAVHFPPPSAPEAAPEAGPAPPP